MVKKVFALAVAGVLGSVVMVACNSPTSSKPATIFSASQMLLSNNAVQGWDSATGSGVYDTAGLRNAIDGGADAYTAIAPFTQALIQKFGNNQDSAISMVFSYSQQSTAASEFKKRTASQVAMPTPLAPFATSVAIGDTSYTGSVNVYAYFGNCYFEISVSASNRPNEIADAVQILQAYQKKTSAD
jgi:hypothetical protein